MASSIVDRLQGVRTSVAYKAPVRLATTANITLSGTQTIDGVAAVLGDRILVKDQSTGTENGIWVVASGAWSRAEDMNGAHDVSQGTQVYVVAGSVNAGLAFRQTTGFPVVGSTGLTWVSAAAPGVDPVSGAASFSTVALLLADTNLTYAPGSDDSVTAGDTVTAGPYRYTVAASGASDHDVATAGGVKLYVDLDALGLTPLAALGGDNDGVTLNNTVLSAALAGGQSVSTRDGVFTSTLAGTAIPARIFGRGQVEDTDGKRAFSFIRQTASVTKAASHDSPTTAFDGDIAKLDRAVEKRITGAATLGQPATGYLQSPENAIDFLYADNASGHNEQTASNGGRTGASVLDIRHNHSGNGDFGCIHLKGNASGAKPGATSFLANPASVGINGDFFALNDGAYLNVIELTMNDLGNDAAAIGAVFRFDRSVGTAALGEVWMGVRVQSEGSADSDVGFSVAGKWKRGADFTSATLDGNAAAITMKQGQRIYLGATASGDVGWSQTVGDDHISFDGASIVTTVNGTSALQVNGSDVIVNSSNGLLVAGTGALQMSGASQFFTGTTTPSFSASNKPGSNSGGPAQWVKIVLGGTDYVIPAWLVN